MVWKKMYEGKKYRKYPTHYRLEMRVRMRMSELYRYIFFSVTFEVTCWNAPFRGILLTPVSGARTQASSAFSQQQKHCSHKNCWFCRNQTSDVGVVVVIEVGKEWEKFCSRRRREHNVAYIIQIS